MSEHYVVVAPDDFGHVTDAREQNEADVACGRMPTYGVELSPVDVIERIEMGNVVMSVEDQWIRARKNLGQNWRKIKCGDVIGPVGSSISRLVVATDSAETAVRPLAIAGTEGPEWLAVDELQDKWEVRYERS